MNLKISEKIILERATQDKICRVCLVPTPYEKLVKRAKYKGTDIQAAYNLCKKCNNKHQAEKRKLNPSLIRKTNSNKRSLKWNLNNKDKVKNRRLLRNYGIGLDWYYNKLITQEFKCTICNKEITEKTGVIDHSHVTTKVRDILCHHCNTGIGFLMEDVAILKQAILYLEKHLCGE